MSYEYLFRAGSPGRPVVVAFHGTGGDQSQLLPLVESIDPDLNYLSPLGQELENGMHARYFKRFAEGHLDEDDLILRAGELATWLPEAIATERVTGLPKVALGYSNGASISAGLLLLHPATFDRAILLRPMVPLVPEVPPDLTGKKVLICASPTDSITPFDGAKRLGEMLKDFGATVEFESVPGGHSLGAKDVEVAQRFLAG